MPNKIGTSAVLTLIFGLMMPLRIYAVDVTLPTYYPALGGEYDQFRLVPRIADLAGACVIGSLYVNSAKQLQYCYDNAGSGTWGMISDVWTQNGHDIYLTDTAAQPDLRDLRVGIGTKTPEFALSLNNDAGIIAQGTFGSGTVLPPALASIGNSRLIWYPRKAAFRAGYAAGTQWDDVNIGNYSAALGKNSTASGDYSIVGGGDGNSATGQYAAIIGGQNNTASGPYAVIVGGASNTASEFYTTIHGGLLNIAANLSSAVGGGQSNEVKNLGTASNIGGGSTNNVLIPYSNISGGKSNTITSTPGLGNSVIGGGESNAVNHDYGVVSGGKNNVANSPYSTIGGGKGNVINYTTSPTPPVGTSSTISGGENNRILGDYSTISGGKNNTVTANYALIGGGFQNTVNNAESASIAGGARNTVNFLTAMIMGGSDNTVDGFNSWAGGKNLQLSATADRTFAWGYSDSPVSITTPDAFILAPGMNGVLPFNPRVGIRDISPTGVLEVNANATSDDYINIKRTASGDVFVVKNNGYIGVNMPTPTVGTHAMQFGNANNAYLSGGGVWTNASSREYKENIQPLTTSQAERTLDGLEPMSFKYKAGRKATVGFIAEDVPDIVAMNDRQSLSSMDIIAVLTKTAQDQDIQINNQAQEIAEINKALEELKRQAHK